MRNLRHHHFDDQVEAQARTVDSPVSLSPPSQAGLGEGIANERSTREEHHER